VQTGSDWQASGVVLGFGFEFPPSGAAEHRSKGRRTLAPCLSVASCASAGLYEKRRESRTESAGQASGIAFLLDTFLWRSKEKYLARGGETRPQMPSEDKLATLHGKPLTKTFIY